MNLLHALIDQPEETKCKLGIHEEAECIKADDLVDSAIFELNWAKRKRWSESYDADVEWAEKVLARCHDIREAIYDYWLDLNS